MYSKYLRSVYWKSLNYEVHNIIYIQSSGAFCVIFLSRRVDLFILEVLPIVKSLLILCNIILFILINTWGIGRGH